MHSEASGKRALKRILAIGLMVSALTAYSPPTAAFNVPGSEVELRGQAPQQPSPVPSFTSKAELVTVDVVVTTKDGQPFGGLTHEDFLVKEDGQAQEIVSFEVVDHRRPAAGEVRGELPPRTFLIVFDDLHMTRQQADQARTALQDILDADFHDSDQVVLVSTAEGNAWNFRRGIDRPAIREILARLRGRRLPDDRCGMSDYEAMAIARDRNADIWESVRQRWIFCHLIVVVPGADTEPPGRRMVKQNAMDRYQTMRQQLSATLEAVGNSIRALGATGGRKSAMLVSQGFVHDPSLGEFREVQVAARLANTAIYYLDVSSRVPTVSSADTNPVIQGTTRSASDSGESQRTAPVIQATARLAFDTAGSELTAEDSGGLSLKGEAPLATRIRTVIAESGAYYLLGYAPKHGQADGRFHKITVAVRADGLAVRARKGYYAATQAAALDRVSPVGAPPAPNLAKGQDPSYARLVALAAGLEAQKAGNLEEALKLWRNGLQRFPRDPAMLLAAGAVYETMGSLRGPVWLVVDDAISRAVMSDPDTRAHDQRSLIAQSDDFYAALADTSPVARRRLALLRSKFLTQAEEHYRKALESDPLREEAHLRLGRVLMLLDRSHPARSELEWVLSHSQTPYLYYLACLFLGRIEESEGKLDAAESAYRAAVILIPDGQTAQLALAHVRRSVSDLQEILESASMRSPAAAPDPWWVYPHGQLRTLDGVLEQLKKALPQ